MRVTVVGFKCHQHYELACQAGGLTLLAGPSGIGKSSLLQAIAWGLYGTLRGVDNHLNRTGRLSVTIQANGLTVYRQKRPGQLKVSMGNWQVEGKEAQAKIDSTFGDQLMWEATVYLSQGSHNSLLTKSQAERLDILNHLAFREDDPEAIIARIDASLQEAKTKYEQSNAAYQVAQLGFAHAAQLSQIEASHARSPQQYTRLCAEMTSLTEQLPGLVRALNDQYRREGQITAQTASLADIRKVLAGINLSDMVGRLTELERLENQHRLALTALQLETKRATLQAQLEALGNAVGQYSPQQIQAAQLSEALHIEHYQRSHRLQVEYDTEALTTAKSALAKVLANQPRDRAWSRLKQLRAQQSQLPSQGPNEDEITRLQQRKLALEQGRQTLICPSCQASVRLTSTGQIALADHPPASPVDIALAEAELNQALMTRQRYLARMQLDKQVEELLASGMDLDDGQEPLSEGELSQLRRRAAELDTVIVMAPPPISSAYMIGCQASADLTAKLAACQQEIEQIKKLRTDERGSSQLLEALKAIRQEIEQQRRLQAQSDHLRKAEAECEESLRSLRRSIDPELSRRVSAANERIASLDKEIREADIHARHVSRCQQLESLQADINANQARYHQLMRLKEAAVSTESQLLQNVVNSINLTIDEIAHSLFDDPIGIRMQLYHTAKTTGRTKPQVNLTISYKGGEYDNLSQLSGGEADRVSLALTLALARLNGTPILLLDECLSSLDSQLRELCLKAIKQHAAGKTIICINHESIEGHYDQVIDLGSAQPV